MDCDCTYATSIGAGCDPGSRQLPNPLYSNTVGTLNDGAAIQGYLNAVPRTDNSLVFLTGIVGVPWQDLATVGSDGTLKYIPTYDPAWILGATDATDTPANPPTNGATGIWDMIYGKDAANIQPKDVHMVESVVPRSGLPGPTAAANADAFIGHEYNTAREDLEYACTYTLPSSRACACDSTSSSYASCKYQHPNDCCDTSYATDGAGGPGDKFDKPLCSGTTQVAAKAYPGLREIEVLHDYATSTTAAAQGNSVVASICPKDLSSDASNPGYGYNPVVSALVDRIGSSLQITCEPRRFTVDATGAVGCRLVEAVPPISTNGMDCTTFCTKNQRTVASGSLASDTTRALQNTKTCDTTGGVSCSAMCLCQLNQETGANLNTCQNDPDGPTITSLPPGFCYVEPAEGAGSNTNLVAQCPASKKRIWRFGGNNPASGTNVPLNGAYLFAMCSAAN